MKLGDKKAVSQIKAQVKNLISRLRKESEGDSIQSKKSGGANLVKIFKKGVADMRKLLHTQKVLETLTDHAETDSKFCQELKKFRKEIREIYKP